MNLNYEDKIKELTEQVKDRENTITMYKEESEKRLYEVMELRGKVAAYERVIACVQSFGACTA